MPEVLTRRVTRTKVKASGAEKTKIVETISETGDDEFEFTGRDRDEIERIHAWLADEDEEPEPRVPRVGDVVLFQLRENDVALINEARHVSRQFDKGIETLLANSVAAGEVYPMIIVRVWGDAPDSRVNGRVILDGNDTHWVTSVRCGEAEGEFLYRDD